ncbi:MAG: WbuC family cupin fold metalloprotein [Fibrobacterota bacterium]
MNDPRFSHIVDESLLNRLSEDALTSARKRVQYELHAGFDDPVQRFLNVLCPQSYIPPHFHPDKWELFSLVRGSAAVLLFHDDGTLARREVLRADGGPAHLCQIPAGIHHSALALSATAVLLEIKPGPFDPDAPKTFSPWAPAEKSNTASAFQSWMKNAVPGQSYSPD